MRNKGVQKSETFSNRRDGCRAPEPRDILKKIGIQYT